MENVWETNEACAEICMLCRTGGRTDGMRVRSNGVGRGRWPDSVTGRMVNREWTKWSFISRSEQTGNE